MRLTLCLTFLVCASGGTPTLLLNIMDTQLEEVRHKIRKAEDEIVEIKQDLIIAKQARNRGGEEDTKFLRGQLLSLNNLLSSLQEKENILLRSQAPSKSRLWLVHTGLPVFTSLCALFSSAHHVACL